MDNSVLIVLLYFFIAFFVIIKPYALRDYKYGEDKMERIFEAILNIIIGILWIFLPVFRFIDKYFRD